MNNFFKENKVFLLGLLASIVVVLQPLLSAAPEELTLKLVAYAIASAVLSYLAKNWRGQGLSLVGIIGNLAVVLGTVLESGTIHVPQLILQFVIAIGLAAGADPKSVGYERTDTIKSAKRQGEQIVPAQLTKKV